MPLNSDAHPQMTAICICLFSGMELFMDSQKCVNSGMNIVKDQVGISPKGHSAPQAMICTLLFRPGLGQWGSVCMLLMYILKYLELFLDFKMYNNTMRRHVFLQSKNLLIGSPGMSLVSILFLLHIMFPYYHILLPVHIVCLGFTLPLL